VFEREGAISSRSGCPYSFASSITQINDPHRHRGQHFEAVQRVGSAVCALQRRLSTVERLRGIPHTGYDSHAAVANAGREDFLPCRSNRPQGERRISSPQTQYAIAIGCDISYDRQMVYADGLDLTSHEAIVAIGPTCRLCDRMDCEQRACPPLQHAFTINESVRGVSFYAPIRS